MENSHTHIHRNSQDTHTHRQSRHTHTDTLAVMRVELTADMVGVVRGNKMKFEFYAKLFHNKLQKMKVVQSYVEMVLIVVAM